MTEIRHEESKETKYQQTLTQMLVNTVNTVKCLTGFIHELKSKGLSF